MTTPAPVKPGYTTTEFWITLLTNLSAIIALVHPGTQLNGIVQGAAVALAAAATVLYTGFRSQLKGQHAALSHGIGLEAINGAINDISVLLNKQPAASHVTVVNNPPAPPA